MTFSFLTGEEFCYSINKGEREKGERDEGREEKRKRQRENRKRERDGTLTGITTLG